MKPINTDSKYFSKIGQDEGINKPLTNPCSLLNVFILCLSNGNTYEGNFGEKEAIFVILGGRCSIEVGNQLYQNIGDRPNVFSGKPYSVYVPSNSSFRVSAFPGNKVEIAVYTANCTDKYEPFLISPEQVIESKSGISNFSRNIHQILVNTDKSVSKLIVGETYTASGNWSSFPPHRHEKDNFPEEVFLEEIYLFKIQPADGFGLATYYSPEHRIEEAYKIKNNSVLFMPEGYYHTLANAPGCTTYYLWALAGNHRVQSPVEDPSLAWVSKTIPVIKNIGENLLP